MRLWFSKGCRGMVARRIQTDLLRQGFVSGDVSRFIDGDYGANTVKAVNALQTRRGITVNGAVDDATWGQLTHDPLPSLFERCLALTAEFEGHGFGKVEGNFDGAGLTWGVIGFTLSHGEIQALLKQFEQQSPGILLRCFGALEPPLRVMLGMPRQRQLAWADAMSSGPSKSNLPPEWVRSFARLGEEPLVKRLQMQRAYDKYFVPAVASAQKLGLHSELGMALAFDVHVQIGFKPTVWAQATGMDAKAPEVERRMLLATWVAQSANPKWQQDVMDRKHCIASAAGAVHGRAYSLAAWGLGEYPAA